jgi:D-alanine transaminase
MSRIAYVDGRYRRHARASVHIEDRGFQFADAVYEVWAVRQGRLLDLDGHFERLARSLRELGIAAPMSPPALLRVLRETLRRNRVRDGLLYLQISRGAARRDHAFPAPGIAPTIVVTARSIDPEDLDARAAAGISVITMPDIRWARRDIKSVSLLPNVLAKQAAKEKGASEAWLIDDEGLVTEGASSNAWIVDAADVLRTRPISNDILAGITRANVLAVARQLGFAISETAFTVEEALAAHEAFVSSAGSGVMPVVAVDGVRISGGKPGSRTLALRNAYFARALEE